MKHLVQIVKKKFPQLPVVKLWTHLSWQKQIERKTFKKPMVMLILWKDVTMFLNSKSWMNKMLLTFQNVAYLLKMKITTWKQKTKYLQQHQIWQATLRPMNLCPKIWPKRKKWNSWKMSLKHLIFQKRDCKNSKYYVKIYKIKRTDIICACQ